MKFLGGPKTREQSHKSLVANIEHQNPHVFSMWAVIHSTRRSFIGVTVLYHMTPTEVDLGWHFHKKYWRQNFASETGKEIIHWEFLNTTLTQIVAVARPENVASNRVITKLGLIFEKTTLVNSNLVNYYSVKRELPN